MKTTRKERDEVLASSGGSWMAFNLASDCNELEDQRNVINAKLDTEMQTAAGLRDKNEDLINEVKMWNDDYRKLGAERDRLRYAMEENAKRLMYERTQSDEAAKAAIARAEKAEAERKLMATVNTGNLFDDEQIAQHRALLVFAYRVAKVLNKDESLSPAQLLDEVCSAIAERDKLREEVNGADHALASAGGRDYQFSIAEQIRHMHAAVASNHQRWEESNKAWNAAIARAERAERELAAIRENLPRRLQFMPHLNMAAAMLDEKNAEDERDQLRAQIAGATSRADRLEDLILKNAKPARDGAWPCVVSVNFGLLAQWNTDDGIEPASPLTPKQALDKRLEVKP